MASPPQVIFPDNVKAMSLDDFMLSFGSNERIADAVLVAMGRTQTTRPALEAAGTSSAIPESLLQQVKSLAVTKKHSGDCAPTNPAVTKARL